MQGGGKCVSVWFFVCSKLSLSKNSHFQARFAYRAKKIKRLLENSFSIIWRLQILMLFISWIKAKKEL